MRKSIVAALAVASVFLVGCGMEDEPPSKEGGTGGTYEYVKVDTDNGESVDCIIWDGTRAGNITCDWNSAD